MKRMLTIFLTGILFFAGCMRQNKEVNVNIPANNNVIYKKTIHAEQPPVKFEIIGLEHSGQSLEVIGAEYRAQWNKDYKYDTPILIDNLIEWEDFLDNHPEYSRTEDALKQNYNEDFFKHSVIYAYIKSMGSGSIMLKVKGARLNGDKLKLLMECIVPEVGTCDMATRICLFGINRDEIKNANTVEAIIEKSNWVAAIV